MSFHTNTCINVLICRNKIDIKQAIDYIAQSWDEVSSNMIYNCWYNIGILQNDIRNIQDKVKEVKEVEEVEVEEKMTINNMVHEVSLHSDNMHRHLVQYVEAIDELLPTEGNLSEVDIINMVKDDTRIESGEMSSDSDDNEQLPKLISTTEALFHLMELIRFQEQLSETLFRPDELKILHRKIPILELLVDKSKVQSTLDSFVRK